MPLDEDLGELARRVQRPAVLPVDGPQRRRRAPTRTLSGCRSQCPTTNGPSADRCPVHAIGVRGQVTQPCGEGPVPRLPGRSAEQVLPHARAGPSPCTTGAAVRACAARPRAAARGACPAGAATSGVRSPTARPLHPAADPGLAAAEAVGHRHDAAGRPVAVTWVGTSTPRRARSGRGGRPRGGRRPTSTAPERALDGVLRVPPTRRCETSPSAPSTADGARHRSVTQPERRPGPTQRSRSRGIPSVLTRGWVRSP